MCEKKSAEFRLKWKKKKLCSMRSSCSVLSKRDKEFLVFLWYFEYFFLESLWIPLKWSEKNYTESHVRTRDLRLQPFINWFDSSQFEFNPRTREKISLNCLRLLRFVSIAHAMLYYKHTATHSANRVSFCLSMWTCTRLTCARAHIFIGISFSESR